MWLLLFVMIMIIVIVFCVICRSDTQDDVSTDQDIPAANRRGRSHHVVFAEIF